MKLSKLTIVFGFYIIVSAAFMRQAWEFVTVQFGAPLAKAFCVALFVVAVSLILVRAFKPRRSFIKSICSIIIAAVGIIFAWRQPYFVEKMHILEYGLLGWLSARDFRDNPSRIKQVMAALLFISLISALDEYFQKILPYRVGEIRDFITNVVSGILGVSLFLSG